MIVDDQLRDLINDEIHTIQLPELSPIDDISRTATRRRRRRTVVNSLATVVLFVALVAAVGTRLRAEPEDVFADTSNPDAIPAFVHARADGTFVGLSQSEPFARNADGNSEFVLVTSRNGSEWLQVGEGHVFVGTDFAFTERDGVVGVVGLRITADNSVATSVQPDLIGWTITPPPNADEVYHATSPDLEVWTEYAHTLPDDLQDQRQVVRDAASLDGGIAVLFEGIATASQLGGDDICAIGSDISSMTYRRCGETEISRIPHNTSEPSPGRRVTLMQINQNGMEQIAPPSWPEFMPSVPQPTLYQTESGVGVASYQAFETTTGKDWEMVSVGLARNTIMASRGNERVYRVRNPVFVSGPDGEGGAMTEVQRPTMAYSPDNGETWQPIDLGLDDLPRDEVPYLHNLVAGEAGWIAQMWRLGRGDIEGFSYDDATFELSKDGYVLTGDLPFGEAELRDAAGEVVRSWDIFELRNPTWSGLEFDGLDIVVPDAETGQPIVTFTSNQWHALFGRDVPGWTDLYFSPNGTDWELLETSADFSQILAVGDNEIVVRRLLPGVFSPVRPVVDVISLADAE